MMGDLLAWFAGARWRMSLSHCVEALGIQAVGAAPFYLAALVLAVLGRSDMADSLGLAAPWAGVAVVLVWYWSRKKIEVEREAKAPGTSDAYTWSIGWWPWAWDADKQHDLWWPTLSSCLIAGIASAPFL